MNDNIGPILGAVAAELRDRQQQPRSTGLRTFDGARLALAAIQDETVAALAVLRDVARCDCGHRGCGHPRVSSVAFAMIGVAAAAIHGVQGIHAALGIDTTPADQSDPIVEAEALRHRWIVAGVDRVNLAAPVADGERVWVPAKGQEQVPDVVAGAGGGSASPVAGNGSAAADGPSGGSALPATPVDLNTATAEELDVLPGVGPATATAILAYRDEHGRFGSVDELLEVRGIGEAKLEELRSLVRV